MDDDTKAFLLIFGFTWAAIFIAAQVYLSSVAVPPPRPGVLLLQSPDLEKGQILSNPIFVGELLAGSRDYIFYIYNNKDYEQIIHINWWLAQIPEEAEYVTFYSSTGSNFTISNQTVLECYVKFTVSDTAPQKSRERLFAFNPDIYVSVTASIEE